MSATARIDARTPTLAANALKDITGYGTYDEIRIIEHGQVAGQWIGGFAIAANSPEWRIISSAVRPGGMISLYGCNVASGGDGYKYLQALAGSRDIWVRGSVGLMNYVDGIAQESWVQWKEYHGP